MNTHEQIAEQLQANSCKWFQGRVCHPEPAEIVRMLRLMHYVLLPNYFEPEGTLDLVDAIHQLEDILAKQIHRAMFQRCMNDGASPDSKETAYSKAEACIQSLPELQEKVYEDVVETYQSDPAATGYDEVILTYPGLFALTVYRMAHILHQVQIPLLPRMMTEYAHRLTGVDLHPGAAIGRSIMIDHGTGIVVGETATVGDHVKIYQGVTLGALYFPRDDAGMMLRKAKRHPTVESDVILYANATVLGGDTVIGHHSVIGSNAWVTESVEPYSKVLYHTENVVKTAQK